MGVWCGCQCMPPIHVHCTHLLRARVHHGSWLVVVAMNVADNKCVCHAHDESSSVSVKKLILKPHPVPMLGSVPV